MSTGFDYILNSIIPSRRHARSENLIPAAEEVMSMLEELAEGQDFSAEELGALLLQKAVAEHFQTKSINLQHWEALSQRQKEVAALACLNHTNAEIAQKLDISLGTVKTHMRAILRKFEVRGRHQLRYILRRWDFSSYDPPPKE